MRGSRPLLTIALACLLVLAGCSGSGGGADMGATQASLGGGDGGAEEKEVEATSTATGDTSAASGDRMRIRTAEFRIRIDEFERSRSNLSATVRAQGGYASNVQVNSHERGNQTFTDGRIVYRVPAENYSAFTAAVRDEGAVLSENENVDDVTRQHADLEARLESLKAERDRLRELYEQANDTEDVLAVQRELADVQREIETTEARLQTLENQVAYSTVTVEFREERPEYDPDRENWYDTGVVAAFLESVDGAIVALRALVVGIAYALPYLVVFGLPAYGVFAIVGRFRGGFSVPFVGGSEGEGGAVEVEEPDDGDEE
jgi:cell division protein FtsB